MNDDRPQAFGESLAQHTATFFQLATEETLVPPNLSTTQRAGRLTRRCASSRIHHRH